MPRRDLSSLTTQQYIDLYNPARSNQISVTPEEWKKMRPVVTRAASTHAHLAISSVSPFLAAATRLAHFALSHHYPMRLAQVFSPSMIDAFSNALPKGAYDPAPLLRRMAVALGTMKPGAGATGTPRPAYRESYSADEIDALLSAARNQPTETRRATMLAVVFLGAGCGVVREAARDVALSDLHRHGDDWFVRTATYCARVREEFYPVIEELRELRPTGLLRGETQPDRVLSEVSKWVANCRGVPTLLADRLRATYVHALMDEGRSLRDLMAWTGLRTGVGLDFYLAQNPPTYLCSTTRSSR